MMLEEASATLEAPTRTSNEAVMEMSLFRAGVFGMVGLPLLRAVVVKEGVKGALSLVKVKSAACGVWLLLSMELLVVET
jgi:hypothetical protein